VSPGGAGFTAEEPIKGYIEAAEEVAALAMGREGGGGYVLGTGKRFKAEVEADTFTSVLCEVTGYPRADSRQNQGSGKRERVLSSLSKADDDKDGSLVLLFLFDLTSNGRQLSGLMSLFSGCWTVSGTI
jgi:hypothetical protein